MFYLLKGTITLKPCKQPQVSLNCSLLTLCQGIHAKCIPMMLLMLVILHDLKSLWSHNSQGIGECPGLCRMFLQPETACRCRRTCRRSATGGSQLGCLHSRKLAWKPKRGPIKTTVPLKWGYMGFHVSLGECRV